MKDYGWMDEISKKVGDGFNFNVYTDLVVPLKIEKNWLLVVFDYECREVRVVGFKMGLTSLPLNQLFPWIKWVWEQGAAGGMKTVAGQLIREKQEAAQWKTLATTIAGNVDTNATSLPVRRMIALLFEMARCDTPALVVVEEQANVLVRDAELGKSVALLSASIASRKVGAFAAREVSEVEVRDFVALNSQEKKLNKGVANAVGGNQVISSAMGGRALGGTLSNQGGNQRQNAGRSVLPSQVSALSQGGNQQQSAGRGGFMSQGNPLNSTFGRK